MPPYESQENRQGTMVMIMLHAIGKHVSRGIAIRGSIRVIIILSVTGCRVSTGTVISGGMLRVTGSKVLRGIMITGIHIMSL